MRRSIVAALALTGSLALAPAAVAYEGGPPHSQDHGTGADHHDHSHGCGCKPKPKPAKPKPKPAKDKKSQKAPDDSAHASGGYNSHRHHSKL